VAGEESKGFCPEMCASFFNSHTQALKLFAFAPQSAKTAFSRGAQRVSKGHSSLWFLFFRHFFVERQRNGIVCGRRVVAAKHTDKSKFETPPSKQKER
jgi:hypothetical protein